MKQKIKEAYHGIFYVQSASMATFGLFNQVVLSFYKCTTFVSPLCSWARFSYVSL